MNKKKCRAVFLLLSTINLFFLLLASQSEAEGQSPEQRLSFGNSNNLSTLIRRGLRKEALTRGYTSGAGGMAISKSLSVNTFDCKLRRVRNFDSVKIKDTVLLANPGEPELPAKITVYTFPKNVQILSVEAVGGTYVPILNKLRIAPAPQPIRREVIPQPKGGLIPDRTIYSSESYFPGKIFTYETGKDTKNTYLYLRFYPVQYIPKTGEAFLITNVSFHIYYEEVK